MPLSIFYLCLPYYHIIPHLSTKIWQLFHYIRLPHHPNSLFIQNSILPSSIANPYLHILLYTTAIIPTSSFNPSPTSPACPISAHSSTSPTACYNPIRPAHALFTRFHFLIYKPHAALRP